MTVSRSLVARFSRDIAQLYTDLLGLGEAEESGALFVAAQRLVEAVSHCARLAQTADAGVAGAAVPADPVEQAHAARMAELMATSVLVRLKALDDRGLLPRPGRRRRLYGLSLSMLRAVRTDGNDGSVEAADPPGGA